MIIFNRIINYIKNIFCNNTIINKKSIFEKSLEVNNYFNNELSILSGSTNIVCLIIDRYYCDNGSRQRELNINNFIDYLINKINPIKIIWFYNRNYLRSRKHTNAFVEDFDLSSFMNIHDRFLFFYDAHKKMYLNKYQIGCSINGFDILDSSSVPIPIFRLCNNIEINIVDISNQNNFLLNNLITYYSSPNWGIP